MTANENRAELLDALRRLGGLFPEWRMGQMLANLAMAAGYADAGAVWDLDDSDALVAARRLLERNRFRDVGPSNPSLTPTTTAPLVSGASSLPQATPATEH